MEHPTKYYEDFEEFKKAQMILKNYQKTHNIIRKDYLNLLEITIESEDNQRSFNTLYRACLRELFSLIESDLYNLNGLDKYDGYSDYDTFMFKFKKTLKQVCSTWQKEEVQRDYFSKNLEKLRNIKKLRDKITHPKDSENFKDATIEDVKLIKEVFSNYSLLIQKLMDGFFIGMKNYPFNNL